MIYRNVKLSEICKDYEGEAYLECFSLYDLKEYPLDQKHGGLLVLPGGGYEYISLREKQPVALRFLSEGFVTFALTYSIHVSYPGPQREVAIAMNYINQHADEFGMIKGSCSVVGFSAGGHLAGSYSYLYPQFHKEMGFELENLRPATTILCYAVLTTTEGTHGVTASIITGEDEAKRWLCDCVKRIDGNYPPTFIWTTEKDGLVPSEQNTKNFIKALEANKVTYKAIIYPDGDHGLSLGNYSVVGAPIKQRDNSDVRDWVKEASDFMVSELKKASKI